jgi:hypothetical protein
MACISGEILAVQSKANSGNGKPEHVARHLQGRASASKSESTALSGLMASIYATAMPLLTRLWQATEDRCLQSLR